MAEADAVRVPVQPDDADPAPWHELYWDAWDALRFDRFYGAMGGEGPITYQALSYYARDHGIVGHDFRVFRAFMSVIDAEWLKFQAEREEKKAPSK